MHTARLESWLRLFAGTVDELIENCRTRLASGATTHIVTVNPEIYQHCVRDTAYRACVDSADVHTIDGVGLSLAALARGHGWIHRITGVDFCEALLRSGSDLTCPIVVIGAAEQARQAFERRAISAGLQVATGTSASVTDVAASAQTIAALIPAQSIVLVALGAPRQEFLIAELRRTSSAANVYVGVGGAIDYLSGYIPRAPLVLRASGFEWLFRLMLEPTVRAKRQLRALPGFFLTQIMVPALTLRWLRPHL